MPSLGGSEVGDAKATTPREDILTETQMREFQKNNLAAALRKTGWRVSGPNGAAALLGVKATTLADRIRAFGLRKPK